MVDYPAMTMDERRWRAEDDARTLAEAERIKEDAARMTAAKEAAKRMADEEMERTKAMRKVAGQKTPSQGSQPREGMGKPRPKNSGFNVFQKI